jgi:hypothetical protein
MSWRDFFSSINRKPDPIESFYLPAVPTRKFPPQLAHRLPNEVITAFVLSGFEATFPFQFGDTTGEPKNKEAFNAVINNMLNDREFVFKRSILVTPAADENNPKSFQVEYRFSQHLLRRNQIIVDSVTTSIITQYNFLLDLMGQLATHRDALNIERDELGAWWCRLRKAPPYREGSFFSNVTALVHAATPGRIMIIFGEMDSDIDAQDQYGWMSQAIRSALDKVISSREP